jgi:hypothetical protein
MNIPIAGNDDLHRVGSVRRAVCAWVSLGVLLHVDPFLEGYIHPG